MRIWLRIKYGVRFIYTRLHARTHARETVCTGVRLTLAIFRAFAFSRDQYFMTIGFIRSFSFFFFFQYRKRNIDHRNEVPQCIIKGGPINFSVAYLCDTVVRSLL